METPLVTVFIAVYNAENYITKSLISIINQTYDNLEILIVDDCSTDSTREKIAEFKDDRIRLIKNKKNMGIPYTRNIGLENAKGKYLAIMDADDISNLNRIEKQVKHMEDNKQIDALGTDYEYIGKRVKRKVRNKYIYPEEIKVRLLFSSPIANPTAMIRMDTVKTYQLKYNEKCFVAQDYDFWLQMSKVGKLEILPVCLFKYRTGHLNISKITRKTKAIKRKTIIDGIRKDAINYYNIPLSDQEIELYNMFFSDNINIYNKISHNEISKLLNKIIKYNESKGIFNKEVFNSVIHRSSLIAISNLNSHLRFKLIAYLKTFKKNNLIFKLKDLSYIILKDIYLKLIR